MNTNKEKRPSEIIQDFLDLIELSHMEFAANKNERNKLGTAYQKERKQRRKHKDVAELYEIIHEFAKSENNKPTLGRLKGMLAKQKAMEGYLFGERKYKRKGGDDSGGNP